MPPSVLSPQTTSNRPQSRNSHVPLPTRSKSGKTNERRSKKRTREFYENINNSNQHYNQLLQDQKSSGKEQATTETVHCNDYNTDGGFGGDFGGDTEDIHDIDDEEYWEDEDNAFEDLPPNSINDQYFEAYINATRMSESQYASDTRQRRVNWSKFVEATCSDVPFYDLNTYCNSETLCTCTKTKTEILGVSLEGLP